MAYFVTGDTHGDFLRVGYFADYESKNSDDVLVILGDAGVNYHGGYVDRTLKKGLATLPLTLFCIHGNHENRPGNLLEYEEVAWRGGTAYVEPEFPNLVFAKDGEIYDLGGRRTLVLGGAHSVDKEIRLAQGWKWFPDEKPSDQIKERAESRLEAEGWRVDVILSHTCPRKFLPINKWSHRGISPYWVFNYDTEDWLDSIEGRLSYRQWYCGHFHIDRKANARLRFVYKDFLELA